MKPIQRHEVCPFLLRCFWRQQTHHSSEKYAPRTPLPENELQIYTWEDASLEELSQLVQNVCPSARKPRAKLSFAIVYPNKRGEMVVSEVGVTTKGQEGPDDDKTLASVRFQPGDYLDVAIR